VNGQLERQQIVGKKDRHTHIHTDIQLEKQTNRKTIRNKEFFKTQKNQTDKQLNRQIYK
jgi:hypothetical protein